MNIYKLSHLDKNHIDHILKLSHICNEYEPYFEEDSPNGEICFFLAYDNNELISFLSYLCVFSQNMTVGSKDEPKDKLEAEITGLTHPEYRNKGYFSMLLNLALDELKSNGVSHVYGALPKNLRNSSLSKGISHSEYLMKLDRDDFLAKNRTFTKTSFVLKKEFEEGNSIPSSYFLFKKKLLPSFTPVGCCHFREGEAFVNLWGVEIKKPYRGKGYGHLFILYVLRDFFGLSQKTIMLNVTSRNIPAIRLYKSCGFRIVEELNYDLL